MGMNNDSLYSVEYKSLSKSKDSRQEIVINDEGGDNLSSISLSILDSIFAEQISKKVTVVFSQGPFNLSPLISCIHACTTNTDVLIGIPKKTYHDNFEKSKEIYFSLLYKKRLNNSNLPLLSNSFYFYEHILWCKGIIDEDTNELDNLEITTTPKHGNKTYKKAYNDILIENLKDGGIQAIPKIVSVPIADIAPSSIVGEKLVKFKNENYNINNFNPKLIIYESINEKKYNFNHLLELIKRSIDSDVKLVLHFSWPYLKGLSKFLSELNNMDDVNTFHLGKRFCIEIGDKLKKPPVALLPLSMEGNLWEMYYPTDPSINFSIVVPKINGTQFFLTSDISNYEFPLDSAVNEIYNSLKYESFPNLETGLLKFPPMFDTVLSPNEIKKRVLKNGLWKTLPINEALGDTSDSKKHSLYIFKGLCSELDNCKDLGYKWRNLFTNERITKKTLFQGYIAEKLNQLLMDADLQFNSVYIANLHPYLATNTSFLESTVHFIASIENLLQYNFPKITKNEDSIFLSFESPSKSILKIPILISGQLQIENLKIILQKYSDFYSIFDISIDKNKTNLNICINLSDSIDHYICDPGHDTIKTSRTSTLTLYSLKLNYSGSFEERRLKDISSSGNPSHILVNGECLFRSENNLSGTIISKNLSLYYGDLSKVHDLSLDIVRTSDLLIPGPIPFHTVSDNDVLISRGYDSLLLPFKNIIFFAYPGYNFKRLQKQVSIYIDLISNKNSLISLRDMLFSVENLCDTKRFTPPTKPSMELIKAAEDNIDTPFDSSVRNELLKVSIDDSEEDIEYKNTLGNIWENIQNKGSPSTGSFPSRSISAKKQIYFSVEYEDGTNDNISFSIDTLIRKKIGGDYLLMPIMDLSEGDTIYYVQSDERESIENYLLRTLLNGEDEMQLESILEPITALKIFYETLTILDYSKHWIEPKMDEIYWLSTDQKKCLFDILCKLINRSSSNEEISELISESIWSAIPVEKLFEIFMSGNKKITMGKLYKLAREMGLNYKESSFKVLCSTAINEQTHYAFQKEDNLLSIGKLLGHQDLINNYNIINQEGGKIGTFLRQVGRSLKRVISGNNDYFNDIDVALSEKIKKCTIVEILNATDL